MNELIAKKYVQALEKSLDLESLGNTAEVLSALAKAIEDPSVASVLNAPQVSKEKRTEILTSAIKGANSKEIENLIKLLVENSRVNLIPDIANVLNKHIADIKKSYRGTVYSDSEIDSNILAQLQSGLGKKFDSTITLSYKKDDFDGIKVDVEDLGIEISFSKTRINKQIVEHILKAI
jgi:F-type H+-transporting ATPase subunit delta